AVIQNSFSNGGSPGGEAVGGETRFAYFPAAAVSDGAAVSVQGADPALTQAGGSVLCFCSGEKKTRQDQQLDRHVVEADPRLQRGHQNRSGEMLEPGRRTVEPARPNTLTTRSKLCVLLRVKEASCPKPVTTSESSVRTTSGCRRATKRWSGWRWTTSC
ncbi:hypothetical protein XENOCAPTIV_015549, partial [Xenoophorus captivus]